MFSSTYRSRLLIQFVKCNNLLTIYIYVYKRLFNCIRDQIEVLQENYVAPCITRTRTNSHEYFYVKQLVRGGKQFFFAQLTTSSVGNLTRTNWKNLYWNYPRRMLSTKKPKCEIGLYALICSCLSWSRRPSCSRSAQPSKYKYNILNKQILYNINYTHIHIYILTGICTCDCKSVVVRYTIVYVCSYISMLN